MFERNELYKVYKISIPIIDMLLPYWSLYIRVGGIDIIDSINLPEEYSDVKKLCATVYAEYKHKEGSIKNEEELFAVQESVSNQILHILQDYIIESIYHKDNFIKIFNENILFIIHKDDNLLCVTAGCDSPKKMTSLLSNFLRQTNPIMLLLEAIDSNKERGFDDMINKGIYDLEAKNALKDADIRCIYSPIYCKSDFHSSENRYTKFYIDSSEFWLNHDLLRKFQEEELGEIDKVIGFSKKGCDSILSIDGICFNNSIIPLVSDFKELYPHNLNAIWRELKNGVYHHKPESVNCITSNGEQKAFLELAKTEDVTNRLSYLVNNLFIPKEHIDKIDGIEDCFNEVTVVDGLSELDNYEFFSSYSDEDKPFIGIHKKDKAGSSAYKLLHYIYKKDNKLSNIQGHNNINNCKNKIAKVLKPNLAFYYLLRYYEDFFSLALNEIKQETGNVIDFVANQNIRINNRENEVDIIAFNGADIYMIELKTNLTIDYIVSYQKKCNTWLHHNSEIANNLKFIIVGNFGSETLNVCGEKEECDGYNEARPNMNGCAYSFFVPLTGNNKLQCFTESSFEKLKSKLMKILIKDEVASN